MARSSLYLPLRYLCSAKITPILASASWPVRTALTRQSLRSRPIRPHGFDPTKPSLPSDLSARLWHGKAFAPVRYVCTALARQSLRSRLIRPYGFGANLAIAIVHTALTRQSFHSRPIRPHG